MLEKSSQSFLGPGCREFESRHSDQISRNGFMPFLLISFGGARLEKSNAARMSAAGEGSTEPILYLRLLAQMQTSLATRTKTASFQYENWRF
ncbi:MAG: hypothetical protein IJO56_03885 [Oscillospiraceae bacterium]|nr:hypothetical protein [Oscillospiraceae bacterium]